jgi:chromosome segregation ATPase
MMHNRSREPGDAVELDLDALQEDIEQGVRAVEMRVRRLMSDFDTERASLINRLREEQNRVRDRDLQLATARQDTERLRGHLASVTARMARHEKDVDALEYEIDLMITRVEARALGALKESGARTNEVLEAKAQAERELAESFRVALREQEETAARALDSIKESEARTKEVLEAKAEAERKSLRAEIAGLAAEIDRLNSELGAIKMSLLWRLTRPFRRNSE